ncbi:MAG: ATP synthase F1 subunit epsilon [Acidithiobacillus sp.]
MEKKRSFRLNVVDVHGEVYSGTVQFVAVPAEMGEIGILPGHAPLLTSLRAGELRINQDDGQKQILFLEGGLLEIQPEVVTILANATLRVMDIDIHDTQSRIKLAEADLRKKTEIPSMDFAKAELELQREIAKLNAYERYQTQEQRGNISAYDWERPPLQNVPTVNVKELED